MGGFLIRRVLQGAATLLLATFLLFCALELVPGDPVRALFGPQAPPPELYEAIRRQFHLDEPLLLQYTLYMGDLLRGDLGNSFPRDPFGQAIGGVPIAPVLAAALPVSVTVLLVSFVGMVAGGTVAGMVSALDLRGVGRIVYAVSVVLASVPVLVLAFALQAFVADYDGPFPPTAQAGDWPGLVLPVLAVAVPAGAYVALVARAQLRSVLREPWVAAARARSLPPRRIVAVHALRGAFADVAAFAGAHVSQLVAGLVVVEGVFDLPGVGWLMLQAIQGQDRSMLLVLVILAIAVVVMVSTFVDILQGVLDPRVAAS